MHSNGANYLESDKTRANLTVFYEHIQTVIFITPKIIQKLYG